MDSAQINFIKLIENNLSVSSVSISKVKEVLYAGEIDLQQICDILHADVQEDIKYAIGTYLALLCYDTPNFDPNMALSYREIKVQKDVLRAAKEYVPITTGDFLSKRELLVNLLCFSGPFVMAIRYDASNPYYKFVKGLPYFDDVPNYAKLNELGWHFFKIDMDAYKFWCENAHCVCNYEYGQMPFTVELEKEFALEIAVLLNDGTLHRIYHMCY